MNETEKEIVQVKSGDLIPVPTTASKAVYSGITGTAVAFLSSLSVAIGDGVTAAEWVNIALATVIGGAASFGITYNVPTRIK